MSAARPTVSVILIVKDGAQHIGEALASVGESEQQPLEILVVDGGSIDDTVAIARSFPGVRVIPQESQGIANAYNEGVAHAQGDLLAFISHDDHWLPGKLDAQVAYMEEHPDLLLSVTHVQHYLEPGSQPPDGFRKELLDQAVPGVLMETLMVRPELFRKVGWFDPSFEVGEDTDWYARVKDAGVTIGVMPETFTMKRVHDTNASLNTPRINAILLKAMRQSIKRKREGTLEKESAGG